MSTIGRRPKIRRRLTSSRASAGSVHVGMPSRTRPLSSHIAFSVRPRPVGGIQGAGEPELVERQGHPAGYGAAHPTALDDEGDPGALGPLAQGAGNGVATG